MNIPKDRAIVFLYLFLVIFSLSAYANLSFFVKTPEQLALFQPFKKNLEKTNNFHLGAEYFFVAKAIVAGKGFSNPFQVNTGPTAWTSPVYPLFLALILKFFKTTVRVALVDLIFKNMILIMTGVLIYEIAKRTLWNIKAYFSLIFYTIWLMGGFWWFFQFTHDTWIVLFFIDSIFLLAVWMWFKPKNAKVFILYGVVSGLAILTNPALGPVCIAIVYKLTHRVNKKILIVPIIIMIAIASIWTVRNYVIFHKLIYIKSNLYYDAYQANYVKDNGIFNKEFFGRHPVWTTKYDTGSEYRKLGELKFVELYKKLFLEKLIKDPYTFLRKVKNRLFATLLVYYPYSDSLETIFKPVMVILHALPFCALLLVVFLRKIRYPYILFAVLIYCIYLTPYILISCYIRYTVPLVALQILFIVWGIDSVFSKLVKKNNALTL